MASVSTPQMAWIASLLTATGVNVSSSLTVTVNVTGGWEVQIPVIVQMSNVSNDPVVNVFPSYDGGATYDINPMTSMALPMNIVAPRTSGSSIRLPTGQYAIQLLASGSQSQTFSVLTGVIITAVNNV